ncbi:MAG: AgmX/PglI C-terminal domain-containing protein [Byssovorax sp.]
MRPHALTALVPILTACGAPPPPVKEAAPPPPVEEHAAPSRPTIESEIGALDEGKVKVAFKKAAEGMSACFNKGAEQIPYLAGDVSFKLRIKQDGSVRWVFVKDSNLGDRETETCMMDVLRKTAWPKPVGGEGLAENSFNFEPGGDERPPVAWKPEQLGKPWKGAKASLGECRKKAGTGPFKATLYVDTDGKPKGIGASFADEKGETAAGCVVDALKSVTFPSPGSYPSKVSVTIE